MNKIYIRSFVAVLLLLAVISVRGQEPDSSASSADSLYVPQSSVMVTPMSMGISSETGLTVSTFAGSGAQGSANGTGTAASFYYPAGGAFDAAGNLYIADVFNHKIRKISPAGVVSTFAGSGAQGSLNGTGTSATFFKPHRLAIDGAGNLYVSDRGNHKVRKITPSGVVSTLAGSGVRGSANGTGTAATFSDPAGIAVDASGNVYLSDEGNHRIRKISPSGVVTTLAGSTVGFVNGTGTVARFNYPKGIALLGANLYVADYNNNRIRKVTLTGVVTTYAGSGTAGSTDGTASSARFYHPLATGADASGNVYVVGGNHRVRKIASNGTVSTLAGTGATGAVNGPALSATFNLPEGVVVHASGDIYIADANNNRVRKLSSPPVVPPEVQLSGNQNYIMSRTYLEPLSSVPSNVTTQQAMVDVSYLDGLGRPQQQVQVKASPNGAKDIVVPVAYDIFGRQDKNYLPYATTTGAGGAFKANAVSSQATYYVSTPPAGQAANPKPFSVTVFEASPLNRVLEQGAPGQVWQPASSRTATTGRTVVTDRTVNNATAFTDLANTRRVALYGVSLATNGAATLTLSNAYAAGQLYVTITKDENWVPATGFSGRLGTTEEYTDKQGQVVLKRTFNLNGGTQEILSTYYVYDDFGNLSFVLPPGIGPDRTTVPTAAELNNFAYQYRYDGRNRMVEKQLPGKGVEYLIYNKLDQVVATQDALQRGKSLQEWTITKYDGLGRVVLSGIYTRPNTTAGTNYRVAVQAEVNAQTGSNAWEESTSTGVGYTSRSWPATGISTTLAVNYYDNYAIPSIPAAYKPATGQSTMVHGLQTASLTKVLGSTGTDNMLWSVMHYDNKGQVVKQYNQHYKDETVSAGNYDEISNTYTFSGQLASSTRKHFAGTTTGTLALTVLTEHTYDHRNRLVDTRKKVDAGAMNIVSRNEYNEVGQLRAKKLHSSNNGTSFGQSVTYAYNPRGWLTESEAELFKQYLKYEEAISGVVPQYNGNISQQQWQHGAAALQTYTYTYDKQNRLLQGIKPQNYGKEALTYDKMGNITTLARGGNSTTVLDALTYTYAGNRLTRVVDSYSEANEGYHLPGTTNYTYDANGNLNTRLNTAQPGNNITAISYNHLNLASSIAATGGNASYVYDAGGRKLSSTQGTVLTEYIDGIEWEDEVLNLVHMEEGRLIKSGSTYTYEYFLKDHLGSNRSGYKVAAPAIATFRSDYFPLGMRYRQDILVGSPENKYLYNGKELQKETGMLDYGARQYDPMIGRWTTVDPLAENDHSFSPYLYGFNNPIKFTDPDGRWPDWPTMGMVHTALDVAGLVPGFGEIADGVNAVIYLAEGNKTDAALSAAAMIPIAGTAATAVKFAKTADKAIAGAKVAEKVADVKMIGPAGDAGAKITKQIPKDWTAKSSKNGQGTVFKDPKNPAGNNVRVQRGNPKSPNPGQQKPYVKQTKNGKVVDTKGKEVKPRTEEAHIPKDEFKF